MDKKKNGIIDKIPNWGWLMISLATAIVLWYVLSITPKTARCFPFIPKVIEALKTVTEREILWADISLQDITEEARAELYRAQAEKYRTEAGMQEE